MVNGRTRTNSAAGNLKSPTSTLTSFLKSKMPPARLLNTAPELKKKSVPDAPPAGWWLNVPELSIVALLRKRLPAPVKFTMPVLAIDKVPPLTLPPVQSSVPVSVGVFAALNVPPLRIVEPAILAPGAKL